MSAQGSAMKYKLKNLSVYEEVVQRKYSLATEDILYEHLL